MACMEHWCVACGHMVFNNQGGPSICPKCGGDMHHTWDEQFDDHDEPERECDEDDD